MASTSSSSSLDRSSAPSTVSTAMTSDNTTAVSTTAAPAAKGQEKTPDDSSKIRTFVSILRKFMGVTDIATVRFSLPSQLLEPIPNLEYWNYLDRPETFASIGRSDDDLGRMLEVLRFWFAKDLKFVKGKPCKPYNSALGEFFRCNWEVTEEELLSAIGDSSSSNGTTNGTTNGATNGTATVNGDAGKPPMKISFLNEQTLHHPPVSAFYIDCPETGVSASGFDQISAKFTGTSIRVGPGQHNLGIFINIRDRDNEEYRLTHPDAHLGGFLKGSLSVNVCDTCYVTCPKTRTKAIIQYLEEGWLGKSQHKVQGVVFKYDPDKDNKTKVKDVPSGDVLAKISGSWHDKIYYTLSGSKEQTILIDVAPLYPAKKVAPPEEDQLFYESRRYWSEVTAAIKNKQYSAATKIKHDLEEVQRERPEMKPDFKGEYTPRFFTERVTPAGKPELSEDGIKAIKGLNEGSYKLEETATI